MNNVHNILERIWKLISSMMSNASGWINVNIARVGGTATAVDDSAMAATPPFIPVGGEYRAAATTYTDGDATVLQTDVNGRLLTDAKVTLNDYTDDSNEFTVGTSMLIAVGGIATSDTVDANDVGAFRMTTSRNLGVDMTTKDGSAWAVNNAINVTIGDGTTVPAVNTAFAETEAIGQASLFTSGLVMGLDTEAGNLAALQVAVDNAGASATPNVLITGGVYKSSVPTYDADDAVPFNMDVSGNLKVTGGASSVQAEYMSPNDFTATFATASTITLAALPISITDASQIVYVKQTTAANTATTYVAGASGISFTWTGGTTVTIYQYGVVITTLVTGDVYEVGINAQRKAYDASADAQKVLEQSPNPNHERTTTLADTVTLDTTQYYHYYFSGSTYHYFYLRLRAVLGAGSSATLKIWASNKTSPTFPTTGAPAAADWQDVSTDILGAASVAHAAATTYDVPYFVDTPMRPLWWLISYNYTDAADSTIYAAVTQSY